MRSKHRVLVVDDDPVVQRSCERVLGQEHEVRICGNGRDGLAALAAETFDVALVDLKLPDTDGMDILRQAPDRFPDVPIVIITGYSTISTAVKAIKLGAFDYVAKPFTPDELAAVVAKAVRQRRLLADHRQLQDALEGGFQVCRLLGDSPPMERVFSLIEQVAPTDSTVLLTGESGTGKDLSARALHFTSARREARFVSLDCGAIAKSLIASELFGHARGAFTGATSDRKGLIQAADGGALFLDQINDLPMDCQTSLLRVIENREVRPVGATASEKVDVRFIAATNRDLQQLVKQGSFREDLFYRLNVFPITLPPLRDRREDIPLLARHFLATFSAKMHKKIHDFTPQGIEVLTQHDWPGNVRELSNVVERIVILLPGNRVGEIQVRESLASPTLASGVPQTAADLKERKEELRSQAVADTEKAFLLEALRRNDYNVTKAAEQTGMQRSNFHALLKKHDLRIRDLIARDD